MPVKKIRVLIVDDSLVSQKLLSGILARDDRFELAGTAGNGVEALEQVKLLRPDVISMDINMPIMNGEESTKRIMQECNVPIVIVSSLYQTMQTDRSIKVLEDGAVAILPKPPGPGHPDFIKASTKYLNMLANLSEIKVVRRTKPAQPDVRETPPLRSKPRPELIVIGASAGGPRAIKSIFENLKAPIPVPVVLVQHIDPLFSKDFCLWMKNHLQMSVKMAIDGETLENGMVYFAPPHKHLIFKEKGVVTLSEDPPYKGNRPSVSHLFESTADVYGNEVLAILLSGMGDDGAAGLKKLFDLGALTIVQEPSSCLIFGMPGAAVQLGAADKILTPKQIASEIRSLFNMPTL